MASRAVTVALAGLLSLAVAMGIGRFAFTPLLPMMLAEGSVDLPRASLLASANYLGYLLGALACTFLPAMSRISGPAWVRGGLVATTLLTLGMALQLPAAWVLLRLAAGIASAIVFLHTTGFCLEQLARRGQPSQGALIYVGPGLGIVGSGLAATVLVQVQAPAAWGWLSFGLLAALLTAWVWRVFDPREDHRPAAPAATATADAAAAAPPASTGPRSEMALLTAAYGLAGIGYIVTATFLPVIARQALPQSHWLDLFWPLFGTGVMVGAIVASRLHPGADLRLRLAACYALQALGVATSLLSPTLAGFALGSLLLGLPFTAITFFAMQEVRRLRPLQATRWMGALTAAYGLGQIVGPPMAAALVQRSATPTTGFNTALWIASGLLLLGVALYGLMAWRYPRRATLAAAPATVSRR